MHIAVETLLTIADKTIFDTLKKSHRYHPSLCDFIFLDYVCNYDALGLQSI